VKFLVQAFEQWLWIGPPLIMKHYSINKQWSIDDDAQLLLSAE
jgi:hypothetical protein